MLRPDRRRTWRLAAPVAFALVATGLAGCATETVTPQSSSAVAYAAVGATAANPGNSVAVVQTATGALGRPVAVGTLPSGLALVPGAQDLLVTVKAQNELAEVATSTGRVVKRIGVGLEPDAVTVTPDGRTALVANFGDDTVTVVHLPDLTSGPTIAVGRQPVAIAVTPDGHQALVVDFQDGTLTPVAIPAYVAGSPVPVGAGPVAVFVTSRIRALVADFQTSGLTPVVLPTLTPQPSIPLGANPTDIDGLVGAGVTWVSAGFGLTPVSSVGGVVGKAIPIGVPAQCLAVTRDAKAWVCGGDGTLVEVDLATGRMLRTVVLGGIPAAAVVAGGAGP